MKKIYLLALLLVLGAANVFAQAYNPFTQNIHFIPEPTVFGYECGSTQQVDFTMGLTTADNATNLSNPLKVKICIAGFEWDGTTPASLVSGSYSTNFTWAFEVGNPNCIIGTQSQTLFGTGTDPLNPNPLSSGNIRLNLKVPPASPVGTVLSVNVTLQVPAYMATYNSIPDDNEATQTQTFCGCYALTNPGIISGDQSFCVSGDPVAFASNAAPTGGSGGVILYQWQQLINGVWTDIPGANASTYDAPAVSATTQYRRTAKRSLCGTWINSNIVTVTINPLPTADAGIDKTITCTTTSVSIGTTAVAGYSYGWAPSTALSATNVAQPVANPTSTINYTVTVTDLATGCTATDVVTVNVNTTPPVANAGPAQTTTCTTVSVTIGTASVVGNSYAWLPTAGLSAANIAQPVANPASTTTYTVTVTGSNGCTATSTVTVTVNKTPPLADAGPDKNLNCTTPSSTIGTAAVAGNSYSWSPATGLSATNIAQPVASPSATTTYTVTVTGANGCTSSDVVVVNVNNTPPTANAGPAQTTTCTTASVTIGTTAIVGNSYSWLPTAGLSSSIVAQPVANPASNTTYTVTVTGSNGCTATSTVTVTVNKTPPTTDAGPDKNLNCSTTSTTIGTTSIAGNTYSWSPATALSATNIAQPTANPTTTTTYTVTVTGTNGCTATDAVTVNVNTTPPVANAGPAQTTTCSSATTTIGTTSIVGNSYSWLPATGLSATNVAQPTANPASNTTYTVTVTGSNGCTATSTVTVTVNKTPPTADAGTDKNLTCAVTSATIGTIAVAGNTYSWGPSLGLSATNIAQPIANPSVTTTYTVTVTGSNGCTATDAVVVNVTTNPPAVDAGVDKNLNCSTTSTTIGTTATAGVTYSWSPATALSATNIAQPTANPTVTTTYTVTATGTNGCTATDVVTVNVNTVPPVANGGSDKTITCTTTSVVIGTTAIAGNTYSWSPATALSATNIAQPTANPTTTTTYTVTVTGSNGCTATSTALVIVNTAPPTVDAGPDKNLNCATTSTTIGTAAISGNTYSWSPSTALNSALIAQPTANPSTTTTYTVSVVGSNGCTASDVVVVNVNTTPPTANAGVDKNLTCAVTSTTIGSAAVVGNSYSWSPAIGLSSTTIAQPTASPSVTTTYTVTVTGANGCTATDVVVVNVNSVPPVVDAGVDRNLTCTTTSATIGSIAIAGVTYSWSPATGLSSTTISQPVANPTVTTTYTVTATGTNGCTATDVVVVNVDTTPPVTDAGPDRNLNCTITFATIGTPSLAGHTYSWSPSTGLSSTTSAQPVASPTATTTYTVTVTGPNGCTATDVVVVSVNTTLPTVDAGVDKTLTCTTTSTTIGTAAIAGYSYLWSPSTALSSVAAAQPTANPTNTTTYTVTVTGTNGCTATDVVVVNVNTTPPTVDAGPDKILTCSTTSTTIGTVAIVGNTYSWSPATALSATNIAQPVASPTTATTYTVTVTGANGCTATDAVTVSLNVAPPVANAGVDKNITCTSTSVILGVVPVVGYTYSWSPATALSATNTAQPTANPTVTTTYTVIVTGSNGCTASDVVVVNVNTTPPAVDAGPDKNLNCNTTSTSIGTPGITGSTYNWSPTNGLSSANIAQPTASPSTTTTYTVTVTGSNGCTATDAVVVNVNTTPPTVDAGPDKSLNCTSTSTTIGTTTIVGNTYSWSPSTGLTSTTVAQPTASPSVTTTYTLTVTGSNGCTATDVVVVNVNSVPPTTDAGPDKLLTCLVTSTLIGTPTVVGNTYSWSPATNLSSTSIAQPVANPSVTTTYTVTVTGTNGCTATDEVVVTVNTAPPTANAGLDKTLTCTTTFTTIGTSAIAGNTYLWTPSTTLSSSSSAQPVASPSVTTSYTVTVTGANGCTATDEVTVNVNVAPPTADAGPDKNINCTTTSTTIGTTSIAGNSYLWSPATGLNSVTLAQPTASPAATTTYTVVVTGANGCTATDVVTVNVSTTPPIVDAGPDKEVCSAIGAEIGTAPLAGITYSWSPATGLNATNIAQPTATPTATTTYTLTATSANGCTSTDVVIVTFKEGTIGNYVWYDMNADGINNEPASSGINGVTVQLFSSIDNVVGNLDDQLVQTTITANNGANPGYYLFKVCTSGNYFVKFPLSPAAGYGLTVQTPTVATDNNSDANTTTGSSPMIAINVVGVGVNKDNMTLDAGYTTPLSLGNQVWVDVNNNGVKDTNENGLPGATVQLYLDNNNDGTPDGPSVETQTTNSSGFYLFQNLIPGNYIVGVTPPTVSTGIYTSSSNGEETNPNSNVDNNDNGVNQTGNQIFSGTVVLAANTEPLGENPNNATNLDANNNQTIDFGFFVCPHPFVFPPIEICAGTTINLTNLEPVGFTGGVWTLNGVPVTSSQVVEGTYVYTYTNGPCTQTGSQTVLTKIPDYAPTIAITPSIVYGVKPVRVVVTVNELLGKDACKPVYVFIPRLEPRYSFTWDPAATQLGSGAAGAVQNAQWQYFTSNPNFYIWKYIANAEVFPGNGQSKFGYVGVYDPNNTDGETTFSVQIFQGSGGENNLLNNTDSELLIYYRQ